MEIGLLGGTFDPVHMGHLIIAEDVRMKLSLSRIIFVPAGHPWLKANREITAGDHRLEMVRLAIEANPCFDVSTAELDRTGPSFSVDTIENLRKELGSEAGIHFIVGPDALSELPRWKSPARLVELCRIVAVGRPNAADVDLGMMESAVPGISSRVSFVEVPQIEISSTEIRRRVKAGLSIRYHVPPEVEAYIREHRLYL